ncbi:unnamed protein product [Boreogadus saida]
MCTFHGPGAGVLALGAVAALFTLNARGNARRPRASLRLWLCDDISRAGGGNAYTHQATNPPAPSPVSRWATAGPEYSTGFLKCSPGPPRQRHTRRRHHHGVPASAQRSRSGRRQREDVSEARAAGCFPVRPRPAQPAGGWCRGTAPGPARASPHKENTEQQRQQQLATGRGPTPCACSSESRACQREKAPNSSTTWPLTNNRALDYFLWGFTESGPPGWPPRNFLKSSWTVDPEPYKVSRQSRAAVGRTNRRAPPLSIILLTHNPVKQRLQKADDLAPAACRLR